MLDGLKIAAEPIRPGPEWILEATATVTLKKVDQMWADLAYLTRKNLRKNMEVNHQINTLPQVHRPLLEWEADPHRREDNLPWDNLPEVNPRDLPWDNHLPWDNLPDSLPDNPPWEDNLRDNLPWGRRRPWEMNDRQWEDVPRLRLPEVEAPRRLARISPNQILLPDIHKPVAAALHPDNLREVRELQ